MHKTASNQSGSLLSRIIHHIREELEITKVNNQPRPDSWYL